MTKQGTDAVASQRDGCRWLHNLPDGAEFGEWFEKNVPIHDGLAASDYVNGVTLIPNKEKVKVTRNDQGGNPAIVEIERLSFSPYPQVETRVRYFWDYCLANGFLGTIELVQARNPHDHLPPGVFTMKVPHQGKDHVWLGASCRIQIHLPDFRTGGKGKVIAEPPIATKMVPIANNWGPDVNSPMKAQTGAIGRALGFAGMLVIPGAGISTAEDMQEFGASQPAALPAVALPPVQTQEPLAEPTDDQGAVLKGLVAELAAELRRDYPVTWEGIEQWAKERNLDLEDSPPASLRPLERQLRRRLEQAKAGK